MSASVQATFGLTRQSSTCCLRGIEHTLGKALTMRPLLQRFLGGAQFQPRAVIVIAMLMGVIAASATFIARADEGPFLDENNAAMSRMMTGMQIQPSGDVDADFVALMVPHHEGAIAMAQAELRYGHNEALRRMAQEIIVTQQQEIAAMRNAVGQSSPSAQSSSTASTR